MKRQYNMLVLSTLYRSATDVIHFSFFLFSCLFWFFLFFFFFIHMGGVMVSLLSSSVIARWFESLLGQTVDYNISIGNIKAVVIAKTD